MCLIINLSENITIMKQFLLAILVVFSTVGYSQTPIPLPPHGSVYNNQARGYWFIAPNDFTISGLRVPSEAGTGPQYIHVMKLNAWNPANPPTWTAQTSNFTTLAYINGATNGVIQNVNIQINTGDIIGILGTANVSNSYATGPFMTTINGQNVSIQRFGYQVNINTGPAPLCWGVALGASGSISRVEMWWIPTVTAPNDAGVTDIIEPTAGCVGTHDVKAEISNLGLNQISNLTVHWSINGAFQGAVPYSQLLDTANGTGQSVDTVTLGTINFINNGNYNIRAWTVNPNSQFDTVNYNDTSEVSITGSNYPVATLGTDTFICPDQPLNLVASSSSPDSLIWNDTVKSNSRIVTTAGTYTVEIYKNGCLTEDSITVSIHPPAPGVNLGNDSTFCYGDQIILNASATGVTYLWQDNSTGATFTVDTSGFYWVSLEDANSCRSSDSIEFDLLKDPSVTVFVSPSTTICYGTPYVFAANGKTSGSEMYQLVVNGVNTGPAQSSNTFASPPLNYGDTVRVDLVTDQCATSDYQVPSNELVMIINPIPKLINGLTSDTVIENTKKSYAITPIATSSYLWRVSGGSIIGDSTTFAVQVQWDGPNTNAWVSLIETDNSNCEYENVLPVTVISVVGVQESESQMLGKAYPNPADKSITIPVYSDNVIDISLEIFDLTGKVVKEVFNGTLKDNRSFDLPVEDLEEGMYFYKLTTSLGEQMTRKLLIRH